jgi:hypothetical protein
MQFRAIRPSGSGCFLYNKQSRVRAVLSRFEIGDGNSWTHIESFESAGITADAIFVPLEDNNSEERGIEWERQNGGKRVTSLDETDNISIYRITYNVRYLMKKEATSEFLSRLIQTTDTYSTI